LVDTDHCHFIYYWPVTGIFRRKCLSPFHLYVILIHVMGEAIIGISAFYHDSAACLVVDGDIVAAAQEERFTRIKHDETFPANALQFLLDNYMSKNTSVTAIAFYEKPYIKFERLLETYHAFAPKGLKSFMVAMPLWIKEKVFMKEKLKEELAKVGLDRVSIFFPEHHLSHAASAFYPSPFDESAIVTVDGVGEWATTTIGKGIGNKIAIIRELNFPHSLGLLYSAFAYFCGFKVNSGEYKLMGLAPYGNRHDDQTVKFESLIHSHLLDLRDDGSFVLNMKYFEFATGFEMTNTKLWEKTFDLPKREEETEITQGYMNLALAIQNVTNEVVRRLALTAKALTGCKNLVMAGGVALNCVSNSAIAKSGIFGRIWVQPAAGDAGGALGAALAVHFISNNKKRTVSGSDSMKGSYLGPAFHDGEILKSLLKCNAELTYVRDDDELSKHTASLLNDGNVVGWFQGRMEFGPRALGNRSILADPRSPHMQKKLNLKIKFREGFRPFAPAVLEEDLPLYFCDSHSSPYMLFTLQFLEELVINFPIGYDGFSLLEKLYFERSQFPAVTHIDYSARVQSVSKKTNLRFWKLLQDFKTFSGHAILINTSFNVRGEPIVCTPIQAYEDFMQTEMDYLVIGNYVLDKLKQPLREDSAMKYFERD
jgi:carbamoyltransferase